VAPTQTLNLLWHIGRTLDLNPSANAREYFTHFEAIFADRIVHSHTQNSAGYAGYFSGRFGYGMWPILVAIEGYLVSHRLFLSYSLS
jgi:hypothetical protein